MISVAILAHEDEKQLPDTLSQARKVADELIVVDSYSEDATPEIAADYGAEVYQTDWMGYADTWQFAFDKTSGDWILQLGSDEVLSDEAVDRIQQIEAEGGNYEGYKIYSINYLLNRKVSHWTRYAPRLFKAGHGRISDDEVHESIQLDGDWGLIHEPIHHYTLESISEHILKLDEYSKLGADDFEEPPTAWDLYGNPLWVLMRLLFIERLVLDGADGLYISLMSAVDSFLTAHRARLRFEGVEGY